jgi:CRISPR-associated protein Cas6
MPSVDLVFQLRGSTIPVDHGYALYAALSRVVPEIHGAQAIGVQPIRGTYTGNGLLQLSDFSRLALRLWVDQIRPYLMLAGKKLDIEGHPLQIGVPSTRALHPAANLRARLVTIKGFLEDAPFLEAAGRQFQSLGVAGEVLLGERRTVRVKEKQVVGYEIAITGLTDEDSLILQERGLGGRRRMGCGIFVPLGGWERRC